MEGWTEDLCRLSTDLCNAIAVELVCVTGSISRCAGDSFLAPSYITCFGDFPFAMAGSQFLVVLADTVSWPNY
jgi:hypothetical protein